MEIIALYGLLRAVDRPDPSTYLRIISTFILLYTTGSSENTYFPLWRQIEAYKLEGHQMCPKPARAARPAIRKSCQKRSPHQDYRFHSFLVVVEF
ncbi:hypothetical protein NEUTE1DRAFT_103732 [Neurospora tetrasperma FGSC 2508]|uniref:Uncharacterized protein n=1 Tax=Neurospora tetrasperma (strain FGSC 2508 / ATCC MYA-4615 / P0657) TaxID=510951 RepID=F8MX03_NEUT8|nr:uncharacterized protein NEUTE1DRAFT_103732 [Neurospora tetrasperma FGSC 2508]EGO54274.1 hypothetical protein NEUTE1DRAFT_103732 [Neurospora tetrasperma FGSC 2508]EGZ68290.1 hypothetical protein NEUTE2DRAFT_132946 [Neurospora tetrasperma FGSC 2509]